MDAKDELRKDLNDHFSSLSLVSDLVGPPDRISVEFPDGDLYDVSVEDVAKHLTKLGWEKPVHCEQCRHLKSRLHDGGRKFYWCDKNQNIPRNKSMQYCGYGKKDKANG
jgi:hypothetical protein